jgi:hypothetical protein
MRPLRRRAAALGALFFLCVAVAGCKKKEKLPLEIEAGPPPVEATADIDAKETIQMIVARYPLTCDASAASRGWAACREASGGYGKVYNCAEKALRESRTALTSLRASTEHRAACAQEIDKAAVAMLNTTPKFFSDVSKWLAERHDALVPALESSPLGEACRASKDLCAGEPHDYDDTYKAMRMHEIDMLDCTTKLFKCGQTDAMDCWVANVVTRLGVACSGTPNRSGSSPEDLLYVRETGTPIAR